MEERNTAELPVVDGMNILWFSMTKLSPGRRERQRRLLHALHGWSCWLYVPHVEHVIPRSLGGTSTLRNLQLAHRTCNMAKGNALRVPPPRPPIVTWDLSIETWVSTGPDTAYLIRGGWAERAAA